MFKKRRARFSFNMQSLQDIQPLDFHEGWDDLDSFKTWVEDIKLEMSRTNPALYVVLGELASSQQPIEQGSMLTSASLGKEATETEKLQRKHEAIKLGCLLVQRTKGETQLQVAKLLQTASSWEAWRQLHRSLHFKLLASLLRLSLDAEPASCLHQFRAWRERVVRLQEFFGEQLSDSVMISVVLNGLQEKTRHLLLLHLDGDSSIGDLGNLLARHLAEQESSLDSLTDKAGRKEEQNRVDDQESHNSLQQQQEHDRQQLVKGGKGKGKDKGEAYNPRPPACKGKGKQHQLPKRYQWCEICWKTGHMTQACWWNPGNQQQEQQHQQQQAWYQPSWEQQTTTQTYNIDQHAAYTEMVPDSNPVLSLEPSSQASTQLASQAPVHNTGLQESLSRASCLAAAWGILVDTGAATSVAPPSFASHSELSPAPSTLKLSTATGKALKIYGLRQVHLQSQGLSLPVSFVIADVVSPLLGLDILMAHRLSLRSENRKSFLVDRAGAKTQLEQRGGHLYMMACLVQHGLSHCFRDSLPPLVVNLSSDEEQSSASQSSSSRDLDEDPSQLEGELGSLNFQCPSVLQNPSAASVAQLDSEHVSCKGEVPVLGGEFHTLSFYPKNLPETTQTSKQDKELHNNHCTIFLLGCAVSHEAKGTALKTQKPRASNKTCQTELDPYELPQSAWQHPASFMAALNRHGEQRRPSAKQASQQKPERSNRSKKGSSDSVSKLHCNLAQPRYSQEPELAYNCASPSHSLPLKLEVSKSAADSGALLSVLGLGCQAFSASSFRPAMEASVAVELPVQSFASIDLDTNLQTRARQEDGAQEIFFSTFKNFSFQTQGQDLASRACRDSNEELKAERACQTSFDSNEEFSAYNCAALQTTVSNEELSAYNCAVLQTTVSNEEFSAYNCAALQTTVSNEELSAYNCAALQTTVSNEELSAYNCAALQTTVCNQEFSAYTCAALLAQSLAQSIAPSLIDESFQHSSFRISSQDPSFRNNIFSNRSFQAISVNSSRRLRPSTRLANFIVSLFAVSSD